MQHFSKPLPNPGRNALTRHCTFYAKGSISLAPLSCLTKSHFFSPTLSSQWMEGLVDVNPIYSCGESRWHSISQWEERTKEGFLICIFVPLPPPLQKTDRGESYSPWRSWRPSWCMVTKPFLTFATKCSRDASRVPTLYHPFTLGRLKSFTKMKVKESY